MYGIESAPKNLWGVHDGWKKVFLNCEFIFTFQPDGCAEPSCTATCFIHFLINQFLSGIRDSRKAGSLWGMMRSVGGVRKSIDQSWLAKGLGLGLLCWGFTRTIHQSTTPSLSPTIWPRWASKQFHTLPKVQILLPVTFGYSLSSEAVVMRQLRRWKKLWRILTNKKQKVQTIVSVNIRMSVVVLIGTS